MKNAEISLWVILCMFFFLQMFTDIPFDLTLLTGCILSSLYFYLGFFLINDVPLKLAFKKETYHNVSSSRLSKSIITGVGFSIVSIAITFYMMHWPGSIFLLLFSIIITSVIYIITRKKALDTNERDVSFYLKLKKRSLLLLILSTLFFIYLFPQIRS